MKIFQTSSINTRDHWLVGTEWQYSKGTVTLHPEGFSCSCRKNPNKACDHIKNVKLRLYGTFDEEYSYG